MKECTVNIKFYDKPIKLVTCTKCQQDNTRCLYKCVIENIFSAQASRGYKPSLLNKLYLKSKQSNTMTVVKVLCKFKIEKTEENHESRTLRKVHFH